MNTLRTWVPAVMPWSEDSLAGGNLDFALESSLDVGSGWVMDANPRDPITS